MKSLIPVAIISIILTFAILTVFTVLDDEYVIITDGECFTYKRGTWVNGDCFKNKEEAQKSLDEFLEFKEKKDTYKNRDWTSVN